MTLHDVWRELIRAGCHNAAVGLLEDLMISLIEYEDASPNRGEGTYHEATCSLLRPMLDDMADGQRLKRFVETFRRDMVEFSVMCDEHVSRTIKDARDN